MNYADSFRALHIQIEHMHSAHGFEGEENDGSGCLPPKFAVTTAAHSPEQLQETQILWPLFSNDNNMPRQSQFLP